MKKKTDLKNYREKTMAQLSKDALDLESKLFDMRKKLYLEKLTKTNKISEAKKTIARIKTIIREKAEAEAIAEIVKKKEGKNA